MRAVRAVVEDVDRGDRVAEFLLHFLQGDRERERRRVALRRILRHRLLEDAREGDRHVGALERGKGRALDPLDQRLGAVLATGSLEGRAAREKCVHRRAELVDVAARIAARRIRE